MGGQMTIWDVHSRPHKPSDYSFQRYIGQKVRLQSGEVGEVVEIEPYYTLVKVGDKHRVGTPTTMKEVKDDTGTDREV